MSAQYVEVPAEAIRGALLAAGFSCDEVTRGREEVYSRGHKHESKYAVRVYTSISSGSARGCGEDAIRVVVTYDGPNGRRGIWKSRRVHRCGSVEAVVERMLERAREGYQHINGILRSPSYLTVTSPRMAAKVGQHGKN